MTTVKECGVQPQCLQKLAEQLAGISRCGLGGLGGLRDFVTSSNALRDTRRNGH